MAEMQPSLTEAILASSAQPCAIQGWCMQESAERVQTLRLTPELPATCAEAASTVTLKCSSTRRPRISLPQVLHRLEVRPS